MTGVLTADRPPKPASPRRYTVTLARDEEDVRAAQRLRHDVFAGEMGALLASPQPGYDIDPFDAYCDHLLVREDTTGQVVGTYRLLPPERAEVAGRLYAESEFDLAALDAIRPGLVEVGRSCVHPDHRDGAVVGLIWAGIARYMTEPVSYRNRVRAKHLAPEEYRVRPLLPWVPRAASVPAGRTELPALLRGYLRLGAWVCGEPAHDVDFGVADLYVLLPMNRVDPRYLRHFLSLVPA